MLSVSSFGRAGPPCRFDAAGINPSMRAEDNCTRQRTAQRQQVHASRDLSLKSAKTPGTPPLRGGGGRGGLIAILCDGASN